MKAIPFVLVLIILGILYLVILSPVFKIKTISFSGDQPSCTTQKDIGNTAGVAGANFWSLDFLKAEQNIKDKYLCIRSVILSKSIPDKVNLNLKNRRAVLTLVPTTVPTTVPTDESTESAKPKPTGEALLVDDEGVIFTFDQRQSSQSMVFILDIDLSIGKKLDQKLIQETLQVLDKLRYLSLNADDPIIYSKNYLSLGIKPKITFILNDKLDRQLASLQLIVDQAKMDTKEIELIDLRFDKPVVKYGKRPSDMRN